MKIKKSNQNRKVIATATVVAVLSIGYLMAAFFLKFPPFTQNNTPPSIGEEIKQSYTPKKSGGTPASQGLPENSASITAEEVSEGTGTVAITGFSQSDGLVKATADVSVNEGTCVFTYSTDGAKPVTQEIPVKSSVCQSSVNEAEFSKLGTWLLKVTFYQDGKKIEATQNVEIK